MMLGYMRIEPMAYYVTLTKEQHLVSLDEGRTFPLTPTLRAALERQRAQARDEHLLTVSPPSPEGQEGSGRPRRVQPGSQH